ncbi:MAG: hypothetical protein ACLRMJ_07065 [Alistipes finegoldii]
MHVEGVFTNALTASLRAAKRFGDDHNLSLTPSFRPRSGTRLSSAEEAFRLTGDRLYNPAWGFQHGKVRNSRAAEFVPLAVVSTGCRFRNRHRLPPISLRNTACAIQCAGMVRRPYADARQLPLPARLYRRPRDRTGVAGRRPRYTQIDWDELIAQNRMAAGHAVYALKTAPSGFGDLNFSALFTTALDARLTLRYGLVSAMRGRAITSRCATCWVRVYHRHRPVSGGRRYLQQPSENDLRRPGRTIRKGGRFGYDYALTTRGPMRGCMPNTAPTASAPISFFRWAPPQSAAAGITEELFPAAVVRPFAPCGLRPIPSGDRRLGLRPAVTSKRRPPAVLPDAADLFYQPQYNNRVIDDPVPNAAMPPKSITAVRAKR